VLDIDLENVAFRYGSSTFAIDGLTITFDRGSHTAIIGPPGCGASTLLRLVAGQLHPQGGTIRIGTRDVTRLPRKRRPLLFVTSRPDDPLRWSVRHVLIAAVRQRTLDRQDRFREVELAAVKWNLEGILNQRVRELSGTEATRVQLARIELLKPAILVADRLFENVNASAASQLIDDFYRTLRVIGTTVITAPAWREEHGTTDRLVALDRGAIVQSGTAAEIYRHPRSEAAISAMAERNLVPIEIRGSSVDSPIGSWEVPDPPFQGSGFAAVPFDAFAAVDGREESDLIVAVEEAQFHEGHWRVQALLSGGRILRVELPLVHDLHKGRLIGLRCSYGRAALIPGVHEGLRRTEQQAIPSMRETR
jgi:iron(III) transport system ATP-binding protein